MYIFVPRALILNTSVIHKNYLKNLLLLIYQNSEVHHWYSLGETYSSRDQMTSFMMLCNCKPLTICCHLVSLPFYYLVLNGSMVMVHVVSSQLNHLYKFALPTKIADSFCKSTNQSILFACTNMISYSCHIGRMFKSVFASGTWETEVY